MTSYPGEDPNGEPTAPYPAYQSPYPPPQAPYAAPAYPPAAPGYGPYPPAGVDHPQAVTALVIGLIGLVGGLSLCGLGFVASPFAWAIGRNAVREIERSQGRIGGEGLARAGMIMGIVGTVLLLLGVLALMLFAVVAVAGSASTSTV